MMTIFWRELYALHQTVGQFSACYSFILCCAWILRGKLYQVMPPIPQRVVTTTGTVLFTGDDIREGQNVWQSIGGHAIGSVWGHGAYVAPDWTADWLHRECMWFLN